MKTVTITNYGKYFTVGVNGSAKKPEIFAVTYKLTALGCFVISVDHLELGITKEKYDEVIQSGHSNPIAIGGMVHLRSEILGLNIVFHD